MAAAAKIGVSYVLGRCVPSVKTNAARIRVTQLVMNQRINMVNRSLLSYPKMYQITAIESFPSGLSITLRFLPF